MRFWRKEQEIQNLVLEHLQCVQQALVPFHKALLLYLDSGNGDKVSELALTTHKAEGKADDVRRQVEAKMIAGALLAPSRRDILEVVERVDKLANGAEGVLDYLQLQKVSIPEQIVPTIREIAERTKDVAIEVDTALRTFFADMQETTKHTAAVEEQEGEVDELERVAIKKLFNLDIDLAEKILVRGFVNKLTKISDRAEDLSDRIDMMVAQRKM